MAIKEKKMNTKKLVITGVLGVFLSVAVIFAIGIFILPTLHHEKILEYRDMEIVNQFEQIYPNSGMVVNSGTLFEQNISFTNYHNARLVTLTLSQGIKGEYITYKCEQGLPGGDTVEIFYFEDPSVDIIKNNVCGPDS